MRGMDEMQETLFTTVKLEDFVPADHPLRAIRLLVNDALKDLNGLFSTIYADSGRASIAPEKLLRALLLQVFYSVRSERRLMEQMRYDMLVRWFVGLAMEDDEWNHSVFSKNRDRLLEHKVIERFFTKVMSVADRHNLLSKDHFSVDGTLIQVWASNKSFRPKDDTDDTPPAGGGRNAEADWRGKRRSNATHESSTEPDARLYKKSAQSPAILSYQGQNRSGLVVGAVVIYVWRQSAEGVKAPIDWAAQYRQLLDEVASLSSDGGIPDAELRSHLAQLVTGVRIRAMGNEVATKGVIVLFVQNLAVSPKAFVGKAFRQAHTCWPLRMRGGRNISARDSDRAISMGARDAGLGISLCGK